jgi:MFS family permease
MDRFGPKKLIRTGVILFGLGFMLLSQIDTLPQLYGAFILIALGASLCGYMPMSVVLIYWFEKSRTRALSAVSLGSTLGAVLVPILAWTMQTYGWRVTAFASGLIVILVGWPLSAIVRNRPEDHGETVDGLPAAPVNPEQGAAATPSHLQGHTAREALRTAAFWLISLGHAFALLAVVAINVHAITHMRESLGYEIAEAAVFFTLMLACQFGGTFLGMLVGDRFDKRHIASVCMLAHMVALLLLAYANGAAMLVAFAILHGTAWGLRGPLMAAMRADYFGRREIGMIIGLSALIYVAGQVGGPMLAGALADLTGNYRTAFTVIAISSGAASLFFMLLKRPAFGGQATVR